MIDRAERAGLGVAVAGHVALFAALSIGLLATPKPLVAPRVAVDIQIVDEVGLRDSAPTPAEAEPAPSIAPEIGPVEPDAVPAPPTAAPPAAVKQALTPAAQPRAAPKPATQRGSRLGANFLKGIADRATASTSQTPRAPAGPAVEASLAREVLRQLKPHWHAPSGADADALRTELSISLSRDGGVADVRVLRTTGLTDSNRGQVRLHQEAAVKAVRLASPFVLPPDLYETWKLLDPVGFDKRLSQ